MNINKDNSLSSKIFLSCHRSEEKTVLGERYFDIPYKLTHYGNVRDTDHLEMILMSSSPGIMGGDTLQQDIICEENAAFKYFTQSFNKVHPAHKSEGSKQICNFTLEAGAKFFYVPHPTIPYRDSSFEALNTIKMTSSSHLIWGDIISGGRIHSGERFELKKYHTKTKVYRDERLILFDNQLIEPSTQPIEDLLFFEGYTHQGTLLLISPYAEAFKKELDAILLEQFTDSSYGFTMCAENAIMVRIMGYSGEALHDWLFNIGNMAWSFFEYQEKEASEAEQTKAEAKEIAVKKQEPKPKKKATTKAKTTTAKKPKTTAKSKPSAKKKTEK